MTWWTPETSGLTLPYGLDEINVVGDALTAVGVPDVMDEEFYRYVLAAAKAHLWGLRSVDRVLGRYAPSWELRVKPDRRASILAHVRREVVAVVKCVYEVPGKQPDDHLFHAGAAVMRLQNTFQASALTIRCGLHFETAALQRLLLEQIAWIFSIGTRSGDWERTSPSQCISGLKPLAPYVGRLYGELSATGHAMPSRLRRYIQATREDIFLVLNDPTRSQHDAVVLLRLADLFGLVCEYVWAGYLPRLERLIRRRGSLCPKRSLPCEKAYVRYSAWLRTRAHPTV